MMFPRRTSQQQQSDHEDDDDIVKMLYRAKALPDPIETGTSQQTTAAAATQELIPRVQSMVNQVNQGGAILSSNSALHSSSTSSLPDFHYNPNLNSHLHKKRSSMVNLTGNYTHQQRQQQQQMQYQQQQQQLQQMQYQLQQSDSIDSRKMAMILQHQQNQMNYDSEMDTNSFPSNHRNALFSAANDSSNNNNNNNNNSNSNRYYQSADTSVLPFSNEYQRTEPSFHSNISSNSSGIGTAAAASSAHSYNDRNILNQNDNNNTNFMNLSQSSLYEQLGKQNNQSGLVSNQLNMMQLLDNPAMQQYQQQQQSWQNNFQNQQFDSNQHDHNMLLHPNNNMLLENRSIQQQLLQQHIQQQQMKQQQEQLLQELQQQDDEVRRLQRQLAIDQQLHQMQQQQSSSMNPIIDPLFDSNENNAMINQEQQEQNLQSEMMMYGFNNNRDKNDDNKLLSGTNLRKNSVETDSFVSSVSSPQLNASSSSFQQQTMISTPSKKNLSSPLMKKTSSLSSRKKRETTFPEKFMKAIIEHTSSITNNETSDSIAWLHDSKSFVIIDSENFVNNIVNQVFKQAKYASFIRKLHRWGFTRLSSGTGKDCFHHPLFNCDKPELASKITCLITGQQGLFKSSSMNSRVHHPSKQLQKQQAIDTDVIISNSPMKGGNTFESQSFGKNIVSSIHNDSSLGLLPSQPQQSLNISNSSSSTIEYSNDFLLGHRIDSQQQDSSITVKNDDSDYKIHTNFNLFRTAVDTPFHANTMMRIDEFKQRGGDMNRSTSNDNNVDKDNNINELSPNQRLNVHNPDVKFD